MGSSIPKRAHPDRAQRARTHDKDRTCGEASLPEAILALQRSAGNGAVAGVLQRAPCEYEPGELAVAATSRGSLASDVSLLGATGSGYNASANSVVVADFSPGSAAVKGSTAAELRGSWINILERQSQPYAVLGFTDCVDKKGINAKLRAERAHAVAAMFPKTAGRASIVAAAPASDFLMPANSTRSERALNRSVLLRLPPEELRQADEVDEYSAEAVRFWRSNPASSVDDLIDLVMGRAGALLDRNGVPKPEVIKGTAPPDGTMAFFNAEKWKITVDEQKMTSDTQPGVTPATKMSVLTVAAVADLASTCYHESRHAEQTFIAARMTAEEAKESMSPRELALELNIPLDIAEAAVLASHTVLPDKLKAQASAWRTVQHGGRYVSYKMWNDNLNSTLKVYSGGLEWEKYKKLGAGSIQMIWERALHSLIDRTFRRDLSFRADSLLRDMKADPHHDPVDEQIAGAFTRTSGELFMALVKEGEGRHLPSPAAIAKMDPAEVKLADLQAQQWIVQLEFALLKVQIAADEAYRAYPNEADAYQVGDAVKESIKRQGT